MSEQKNGITPIEPPVIDLPASAFPEPHCEAMTRNGQPCRNRPLDGQRYCRVHAALAGASSAVPSEAVTLVGSSAEAPVELEVEQTAEELEMGSAAQAPAEPAVEQTVEELDVGGAAEAPAEPAVEVGIRNVSELDQVAAAVQELEVEIRNQTGGPAEQRDLAAGVLQLIRENLLRMPSSAAQRAIGMIRENISSDYLSADFWRGIGMVLRYQIDETTALIQRRMRGEYTTDAYGMDAELIDLVRPLSSFLYRTYWRVSVEGLENVPSEGRALLVSNHGGVLPWDAVMIATAVMEDHSEPRVIRTLYPSAFRALPGIGSLLSAFGQVHDTPENAVRLLQEDQLVCVFPEGVNGLGKLFRNRYKLQRFRRGGSVGVAIRASAPVVPIAVVGSEETYPMLANAEPLAQMLRLPYFPITPLFPWLGPLGLLPLPSKWTITFGEPISTAEYRPEAADDPQAVSRLTDQVRERIQALLDERLAARKSVFKG